MSIINKFVNSFNNLGDNYDDDDYLDDYYDDDLDDYEDKKSNKVNLFKGNRSRNKSSYNEPSPAPRRNSGMGVCVIKPASIDDGREICDTLLDGRTVILNVEGVDLEIAQRIIDFTTGAAYSLDGRLQKINNSIFLVTPVNVDISGDLQDILGGGSFDSSSIRNRY